MLNRLALRRAPRLARLVSNASNRPQSFLSRRRALLVSGAVTATALACTTSALVFADAPRDEVPEVHQRRSAPLSELVRSYFVYTLCSFPTLVDWSPAVLSALTSVPILKQITETFVEKTFFTHFVGGPSTTQCLPLLERLRFENKGVLFAYSVEVDADEASGRGSLKSKEPVHKRIVKEMLHSIDVAADFEDSHTSESHLPSNRRTWVAVKLTALVPDHEALVNLSKHLIDSSHGKTPVAFPGCPRPNGLQVLRGSTPAQSDHLRRKDIVDLSELYEDLRSICARAQDRNVRVIIDAEHSWYQPAIDTIALELMREFNRSQVSYPLVYTTFQAYLRRCPEYLMQSIKDAKAGNYTLGVKLVRGAYHEQEVAVHAEPSASPSISPDPLPPVWLSKAETDECYNRCVRILLQTVATDVQAEGALSSNKWLAKLSKMASDSTPTAGILFGSHNWDSVRLILLTLQDTNLARPIKNTPNNVSTTEPVLEIRANVADRITLAQLYGMSDALTDYIVARTRSSTPFVIKYVPYGALSEVMPYLARRAIENKAVLGNGQAALERQQAWVEIRKRMHIFT